MNSAVTHQMERAFTGVFYALLLALALYLVKLVLSFVLRRRLGPGLVPGLQDGRPDAFFPRMLSLVGLYSEPRQSLGMTMLRTTIGMRLVAWAGVALFLYFHRQMQAPTVGLESLMVVLVTLNALALSVYEIRYDRADVVLPRWWFGHTTHRWRDLVAVIDRDPWMVTLHFSDGRRVKVHKYIVGHAEFMAVAKASIRHI